MGETFPGDQESDLSLLFAWVTTAADDEPQNSELAEIVLKKYQALPSKVVAREPVSHEVEDFLTENLSSVERSGPIHFIFANSGRVAVQFFGAAVLLVSLFGIVALPFLNLFGYSEMENIRIACGVGILIAVLTTMFSEKIANYILGTSKPGDILRILGKPDEVVVVHRSSPVLKNGRLEESHSSVAFSKKYLVCVDFVSLFSQKPVKKFSDYATCYICIDFLFSTQPTGEWKEYLVGKAIFVLSYLYAFQKDSRFLVYELGMLHLKTNNLEMAQSFFDECVKLNHNDWMAEAWNSVIDFRKVSNPTMFSS
jgi:hypothetical protein